MACLEGSNVSEPNSVLLLGLITMGCREGIILKSFEIIAFIVIGTSNVDLAIRGRDYVTPG